MEVPCANPTKDAQESSWLSSLTTITAGFLGKWVAATMRVVLTVFTGLVDMIMADFSCTKAQRLEELGRDHKGCKC